MCQISVGYNSRPQLPLLLTTLCQCSAKVGLITETHTHTCTHTSSPAICFCFFLPKKWHLTHEGLTEDQKCVCMWVSECFLMVILWACKCLHYLCLINDIAHSLTSTLQAHFHDSSDKQKTELSVFIFQAQLCIYRCVSEQDCAHLLSCTNTLGSLFRV